MRESVSVISNYNFSVAQTSFGLFLTTSLAQLPSQQGTQGKLFLYTAGYGRAFLLHSQVLFTTTFASLCDY